MRSSTLLSGRWLPALALLLAGPALLASPAVGGERHMAGSTAALDSLIRAERDFSAFSAARGMREAFLTFLADDGLIFRPGPINGRASWRARKDPPATLKWEPSLAEVAASGDLGFTAGPWEFRPIDKGQPIAYGHFISIWKRSADSPWRVALDLGISHEKPAHGLGNVTLERGPRHVMTSTPRPRGFSIGAGVLSGGMGFGLGTTSSPRAYAEDAAHDLHTMMTAERTYGWMLKTRDAAMTFATLAAEDVHLYRDGVEPVIGLDPAVRALSDRKGRLEWAVQGHGIASAGDLGYAYGRLEIRPEPGAKADSSAFLHVWRRDRDGNWKLALARENPVPEARP